MSFKAMAWAAEQEPPTATAKLALIMMASMADGESKTCFPSHQHLADQCMVSRRTMVTTLKALEKHGYITVKNRTRKGGKTSNLYTLAMCKICTRDVQDLHKGSDTVAQGGSEIVAHETVTLSKQSPKQSLKQRERDFDRWYQEFPKKLARKVALKAWLKAKDLPDITTLLAILASQMQEGQILHGDPKYMPYPATYINQERWNDELQTTTTEETGFDRNIRLANEHLSEAGRDANLHGETLDVDGRALPPPLVQ